MYEGRDRCRELIEELQSTQALEQQGQQERRVERVHMVELQRLQNDRSMQEDRLCEILNSLEGKTVCGTLDFLSKVSFGGAWKLTLVERRSRVIYLPAFSGAGEIGGRA